MLEVILENEDVWTHTFAIISKVREHAKKPCKQIFFQQKYNWGWKLKLCKNINFDSFQMHPENLYKRTPVSYKMCLRWSWKIIFSQNINFEGACSVCFLSTLKKYTGEHPSHVKYAWGDPGKSSCLKISNSSHFECACWDVILNTLKSYTGGDPSHIKYAWGDPGKSSCMKI